MNVENCSNCGRVIGKLERAYIFHENVVCQDCYRKLTNTEDKQPQTETKEQAGAKSNKFLVVCGLILILLVACFALPLVVKLVIRWGPLSVPTSSNSLQTTIDKANKGDANAQSRLGKMYYYGEGVTENYKEAAKWFTKAAEQGDAMAQTFLGLMYYDGEGVSQDYTEAYKWALLAQMNGAKGTLKEELASKMTPTQIAEAKKLAKEFTEKQEKEKTEKDTKASGLK